MKPLTFKPLAALGRLFSVGGRHPVALDRWGRRVSCPWCAANIAQPKVGRPRVTCGYPECVRAETNAHRRRARVSP